MTVGETIAARVDIVDRLNELPTMAATDADFTKMRKFADDAIAEIEAMRRGFKSLSRAIEREGYAVLVDPDGEFNLHQPIPEPAGAAVDYAYEDRRIEAGLVQLNSQDEAVRADARRILRALGVFKHPTTGETI